MADEKPFALGDKVLLSCGTVERIPAMIFMVSPNGRSLFLSFQAIIDGHVGMMPVLQHENGSGFIAIMTGKPVVLQRVR